MAMKLVVVIYGDYGRSPSKKKKKIMEDPKWPNLQCDHTVLIKLINELSFFQKRIKKGFKALLNIKFIIISYKLLKDDL